MLRVEFEGGQGFRLYIARHNIAPSYGAHHADRLRPGVRLMACAGLFLCTLTAVPACQRSGIVYRNELTGETVEVRQPPKSIAPATFSRGGATTQPATGYLNSPSPWSSPLQASTGNQQTHDFAGESQTEMLTWAGIALCILGAVGLILRAYLPVVPMSACLICAGMGAALIAYGRLLNHPGLLIGGAAIAGSIILIGLWDNKHKLDQVKAAQSSV